MIQSNISNDKKGLAKYINNHIYGVLKPYGYKKSGNDFYLRKGELDCLINIQKNRYSGPDKEDFTLNWALCFPVDAYFYNRKLHNKPSFSRCLINHIVPWLKLQNGLWWSLSIGSTSQEIDKVLKDVEYYIREYGVPFLEKLNTIEDVIEMLEATKVNSSFRGFYPRHLNPEPFQAILYLFINQKEKSLEIMDKVIRETKSELYRENMQGLKEKIGKFDPTSIPHHQV